MTKKKSFLGLVLALVLIIPCMFFMTACGGENGKTKVDIPIAEVTSFVYDSTEKTLVITENENYTITGNKATNVGSYTATIALNDKENCVWSDETTENKTISWTITAQESTLSFDISGKTYDGEPMTNPTVTTNRDSEDVTIEWFAGETAVTDEVALDSAPSDAGTYRVKASVLANTNFTANSLTKTVTIAKREVTINWKTQAEFEAHFDNTAAIYSGSSRGGYLAGLMNGTWCLSNLISGATSTDVRINLSFTGDTTNVTAEGFRAYVTGLGGEKKDNYVLTNDCTDGKYYSPHTYYVRPSNATLTLTATNVEWTATGKIFKGNDIRTLVADVDLTAMDGETSVPLTNVTATVHTTNGSAISLIPLTSEQLNGLADIDVTKNLCLKITGKNANYGIGTVAKIIRFKIGSSTEISTFNNSINFNFVAGNRGDFTRYIITDTYTHQFFKISGLSNNVVANVVGADKLNGDDLISTDDWYVIDNEDEVVITLIHETSAQQLVQIVPCAPDGTIDNDMNYDIDITAGKSIYLCRVTNLDDHTLYCFTGDSEGLLVNAFEVHIFYELDSTLGDIVSMWQMYQGQTDAYVIIVTNGTAGTISLDTYHG